MERQDYNETVTAVRDAYEDVKAGCTRPAVDFLEELRTKHGFPRLNLPESRQDAEAVLDWLNSEGAGKLVWVVRTAERRYRLPRRRCRAVVSLPRRMFRFLSSCGNCSTATSGTSTAYCSRLKTTSFTCFTSVTDAAVA